jgi:23S rRNA pseudouridine1911/1915/1917 synthase
VGPRERRTREETIVVPRERAGLELDEFLCLWFPASARAFLRQQVRDGLVLLDGLRVQPSQRPAPRPGRHRGLDEDAAPPPPVDTGLAIPVLYEDADLLVLDKPAGLAVEPERWARSNASLAGALLSLARARSSPAANGSAPLELRLRNVHRLDKDTSGALVVAKHLEAERALRTAFERTASKKTTTALVEGEHPLADGAEDLIDLAIGPDENGAAAACGPAGRASPRARASPS